MHSNRLPSALGRVLDIFGMNAPTYTIKYLIKKHKTIDREMKNIEIAERKVSSQFFSVQQGLIFIPMPQ